MQLINHKGKGKEMKERGATNVTKLRRLYDRLQEILKMDFVSCGKKGINVWVCLLVH